MKANRSSRTLPASAHETIESVADLERVADRNLSEHQRRIERATAFLGRPRIVYAVIGFTLLWVAVNIGLGSHGRAFDPPPFAYLDCIISLAALLMTIVILTTENRINTDIARRDRLDLQINLLNERKISKVIEMLDALRRDSPDVPDRHDPQAHTLREITDPAQVVRALDERMPDTE